MFSVILQHLLKLLLVNQGHVEPGAALNKSGTMQKYTLEIMLM